MNGELKAAGVKKPQEDDEMIELQYSLLIETADEPDYFGFCYPELEGFTGIGHSVKDCFYKAKWGMEEHVDLLKDQGLPVPPRNPDPKLLFRMRKRLLSPKFPNPQSKMICLQPRAKRSSTLQLYASDAHFFCNGPRTMDY